MRNLFSRGRNTGGFPSTDAGKGDLNQYKYDLIPANKNVTMQLAGSDPHQEELVRFSGSGQLEAFIAKRTLEEERTDAPIPVRLFADSRMGGVVGFVPRGLEAAVIEAIARLENQGRKTRIPVEIVSTRHGLRVRLLMGLTR